MTLYRIFILCASVTPLLCAPSGCIESCASYHQTQSYQTQQATNTRSDNHANVQDINNLDLYYNKPGNWTEHNTYRTDGGHGKIYEERGQYVQGPKRIRYFKKNYTSHVNSPTLIEHERLASSLANYNSMPIINSKQTLERSENSELYRRQETYDQQHEQSYNQRSEHLSNIDKNSQAFHHGLLNAGTQNLHEQNGYVDTRPGNWTKVDEYKTDDGHGRVFEEEGQYVTGPKKVRYYRKNYTSSYSTGNVPKSDINSNYAFDLEREMQKLQQELNNHGREIHQSLLPSSRNILQVTNSMHDTVTPRFVNKHLQDAENVNSGRSYERIYETPHAYPENQYNTETHSRTSNIRTAYPIRNIEKERVYSESQSTHSLQPGSYNYFDSRSSNYDRLPSDRSRNYPSYSNDKQEANHYMQSEEYQRQFSSINQAELVQNQASNSHSQQNTAYQNIATYPQTKGHTRHYEENWSSSQVPSYDHSDSYKTHKYRNSHSSHQTVQTHNAGASQLGGSRYNSEYHTGLGQLVTGVVDLDRGTQQYADCTQETEQMQYSSRGKRDAKYNEFDDMLQNSQSRDRLDQTHYYPPELSYNNGELSNFHHVSGALSQQYSRRFGYKQEKHTSHNQRYEDLTQEDTNLQQQTSGFDDLLGTLELESQMQQSTQSNEDLTQQTNQYDDFAQQLQHNHQIQWPVEDLTQQNENLAQQNEQFMQQNENLTQQNKQFTQQNEDLSQQNEHFTQQNEDFTHQNERSTQQNEDLTQHNKHFTQQNEDLTQQNEQFSQQNEDLSQQNEHFTQQNEDFTQQNKWFTQQNEDLSQHNKHFTQQTEDLIEQNEQSKHQNEDLTQQINKFDKYSPQTLQQLLNRPKPDKYTNGDSINSIRRDSIQQTINHDFSEQKPGTLEHGSQMQPLHTPKKLDTNNQHSKWLTQENMDFTQQTGGFDDFDQDASRNLEHTQLTQQPTYGINNQHLEHLTQQTNRFDDQQYGSRKPEYRQQTEQLMYKPERSEAENQYFMDLAQHNEGITQQTSKLNDDFFGKSSEKLISESQTQLSHNLNKPDINKEQLKDFNEQNENFMQQTQKVDNSQVLGKLEFSQNNKDEIEQTERFDGLSQQTSTNWEHGQKTQDLLHPLDNSASINTSEDLTQQANEPNNLIYKDTNSDQLQTPAPKPKLKARYQRPNLSYNNQETDFDKSSTNVDIDNNKSEKIQRGDQGINIYNSDQFNFTKVNKSTESDKTDDNRNLQWRPSSKDSLEGQVHQSEIYPSVDSNFEFQHTQQSQYKQELNFQNQKFRSQTENEESNRAGHLTEEQINNYNQDTGFVKGRKKWHHFNRRLEHTRHIDSSSNNNYGFVETTQTPTFNQDFQQQQWNMHQMENSKYNGNTETKLEPRILEAYGAGPYDVNHGDDIFDNVTPKPDALLPPYLSKDLWDIQEKEEKVLPLPETTETIETTTMTEAPPNFWGRIGHKITNTFGKAREKAKEIFG